MADTYQRGAQAPRPTEIDLTTADYSRPEYACDVLMKGGVTSGVVYPSAICRLAEKYTFANIGGTSAGAIAAALAAAAEYRRCASHDRDGRGFQLLAGLPNVLQSDKTLLRLFQPSSATRPLFLTLLDATNSAIPLWKKGFRAVRYHWRDAAIPGVIAAAVCVVLLRDTRNDPIGLAIASSLTADLVASVVILAVAKRIWTTLRVDVAKNHFGMCTGATMPGNAVPALTPWLAAQIALYSGHPLLTFGDLWTAGATCTARAAAPGVNPHVEMNRARAERVVNLEMVTTNVTIGRPYRLPFGDLEDLDFYFDPNEWRDYFDQAIIDHMCPHAAANSTACTESKPFNDAGVYRTIHPFPPGERLPVVVAARMSLSFPLLFSAVPLYAVPRRGSAAKRPFKCWFSDGGITSNLPLHFFDGPLSRRPTFALNLRSAETPTTMSDPDVSMADTNEPEIQVIPEGVAKSLPRFFGAIFDAMQNWTDNNQMRLKGYRERVVEIAIGPNEGGLRLDMDPHALEDLQHKGYRAGDELRNEFLPVGVPPEPTARWTEHRTTRVRSALAMADEWLRAFWKTSGASQTPPDPTYTNIVNGYAWNSPAQAQEASTVYELLLHEGERLENVADAADVSSGAPIPGPHLRARPRE